MQTQVKSAAVLISLLECLQDSHISPAHETKIKFQCAGTCSDHPSAYPGIEGYTTNSLIRSECKKPILLRLYISTFWFFYLERYKFQFKCVFHIYGMFNVSLPEFQHLISAVSIPERATVLVSIPVIETFLGVLINLSPFLNNTTKSNIALKWACIGHEVQELVEFKKERRNTTSDLKKNSKNHISVIIIKYASTHFTLITREFISRPPAVLALPKPLPGNRGQMPNRPVFPNERAYRKLI